MRANKIGWLAVLLISAVPACVKNGDSGGDGSGSDPWQKLLASRQYNYPAALRTASLRLRGKLPTVEEIEQLNSASDQKTTYAGMIAGFLADPSFAGQMLAFSRDMMKMGDPQGTNPALDGPPAFLTQLTLQGGSYMSLFTATSGNCPTVQTDATGAVTITAGECNSGAPAQSGLLTSPGFEAQFYSHGAFRRVRALNEVFTCQAAPVEVTTPQNVGGAAPYTSPWPFTRVADLTTGGHINFRDVSSTICANCHTTMNGIAPLLANFDQNGNYQPTIAVTLPLPGEPVAALSDYLTTGQQTAWRINAPASNLTQLGQAMAADPNVAACAVARVWNWAFGKGDIVDDQAAVPTSVIQPIIDDFNANKGNLQTVLTDVFTSDDFTKY
jgi:hypothetical protein